MRMQPKQCTYFSGELCNSKKMQGRDEWMTHLQFIRLELSRVSLRCEAVVLAFGNHDRLPGRRGRRAHGPVRPGTSNSSTPCTCTHHQFTATSLTYRPEAGPRLIGGGGGGSCGRDHLRVKKGPVRRETRLPSSPPVSRGALTAPPSAAPETANAAIFASAAAGSDRADQWQC